MAASAPFPVGSRSIQTAHGLLQPSDQQVGGITSQHLSMVPRIPRCPLSTYIPGIAFFMADMSGSSACCPPDPELTAEIGGL
jgi:hypothetical protein